MSKSRLPRASELPNLTAFVRGYLHEDVIAEHGNATAAAEAFARDASEAERRAVARELDQVASALGTRAAAELSKFFVEKLRAAWAPSSREELQLLIAKIAGRDATPRRGSNPTTPSFDVGDCIAIECADGRLGAAVVTRRNETPSATSYILTAVDVPAEGQLALSHFVPPRWRAVHPERPDLVVKFEVHDAGWRRHRDRYRLIGRIDPGEVPQPLTLRLATWATLWQTFPS